MRSRRLTPASSCRAWLALAEVQLHNGDAVEADAAVAAALRLYEAKGNVAAAGPLRPATSEASL